MDRAKISLEKKITIKRLLKARFSQRYIGKTLSVSKNMRLECGKENKIKFTVIEFT